MRERWRLLLLPALLQPSAEISLNLVEKKSHQSSTILAQTMLGLDEKQGFLSDMEQHGMKYKEYA